MQSAKSERVGKKSVSKRLGGQSCHGGGGVGKDRRGAHSYRNNDHTSD